MGYHWNWLVFAQPVPTGEPTFLGWLLAGLRMTLLLPPASGGLRPPAQRPPGPLPGGGRPIVPPLTSEMLNTFKNSAVCSTIGLLELAAQGRQLVDYTSQAYESFIAVTVLYLIINVAIMLIMRQVEKHTRVPGLIGTADR